MWCTWYKNPCFALHQKRTQHGQLRSIAVCCGQSKTPVTLRQFAKVQVEELGPPRWLVYCQGEGRGFESRRPLQRKSRSEPIVWERRADHRSALYKFAMPSATARCEIPVHAFLRSLLEPAVESGYRVLTHAGHTPDPLVPDGERTGQIEPVLVVTSKSQGFGSVLADEVQGVFSLRQPARRVVSSAIQRSS